jgi:hypothetical protein
VEIGADVEIGVGIERCGGIAIEIELQHDD